MEDHTMSYAKIQVKPISSALGAVIEGVDLSQVDEDSLAEIRHALFIHHIILFRNQNISVEQQLALMRKLGPLLTHPPEVGLPAHPEVMTLDQDEKREQFVAWNQWHSDMSYGSKPCRESMVYCELSDGFGGDSLFANQNLAYESLSRTTQAMLDNLKAIHVLRNKDVQENLQSESQKNARATDIHTQTIHPLVRTLQDTGIKTLFINPRYVEKIHGMTDSESKMLLEFLFDHISQEAFSCRINWETDTLVMWDNRCVQHYNLGDYQGTKRKMHKISVRGEKPY